MQNKFFLYLLEVGGIQDFLFSSNNLQVNIGASALVRAITEEWVIAILQDKEINIEYAPYSPTLQFSEKCIENNNLDAEIIYIGGGNALIIFKTEDLIWKFERELSRKVLIEAQGISLVSEYMEIDLDSDNLKERNSELHRSLSKKKTSLQPQGSLLGLGISARCVFSAEPAAGIWDDPGHNPLRVSDQVISKLKYVRVAESYLADIKNHVEGFTELKLGFISNFDDFGEKGVSSYIAIVHCDGNRMGKRLEELGSTLNFPDDNRNYLEILRSFSESSKSAAINALVSTLETLLKSLQFEGNSCFIQQKYNTAGEPLTEAEKSMLPRVEVDISKLPFRPLVFGGDDVTFICDGRLGLALAKLFLVHYRNQFLEEGLNPKKPPVGRAGVAIIPNHYPFSEGYSLAEELSGLAKQAGDSGTEPSIDWHIGKNGIVKPLSIIRRDQYHTEFGRLLKRPLRLDNGSDFDFSTFEHINKSFQSDEAWIKRRNKVKALYAVMREGGERVGSFISNSKLPPLPANTYLQTLSKLDQKGWYSGQCYYFDALEALDFYVPLEV